jgi:hypothetical protein
MATLLRTNLIGSICTHMKSCGWNDDKEWTIGVSHDAGERLKRHGQDANPSAKSFEASSEAAARETEVWLQTNFPRLNVDKDARKPPKPPTQVYVFRTPRGERSTARPAK